jgi:ribonuclease BN (tRNA processing enzyme)
MSLRFYWILLVGIGMLTSCTPPHPMIQPSDTQLVLLGTGTPNADPDRFGPALAIVVNQQAYLVDAGAGVVRRAAAAANTGISALAADKLNMLFISHLHSDHTIGYPDFILTPGVLERKGPAHVFGPPGTEKMTDHILQAYAEDIHLRVHGLEGGDSLAYKIKVHEIVPGLIYQDTNISVTAFPVNHGSWEHAFGFRFETSDRVIVVSGDCTYSESLIENAKGCDILVHEVYSEEGYAGRPEKWKKYHAQFHTSSSDLAKLAAIIKPKLLVLTHQLIWTSTEEKLLQEIASKYPGAVVSGKDLDIY